MSRNFKHLLVGVAGLTAAWSSASSAQEMRPALTAASAKAIVAGCEAFPGDWPRSQHRDF